MRLDGRQGFSDLVEGCVLAVGQRLQIRGRALVLLAGVRDQRGFLRRERYAFEQGLKLGCALRAHAAGIPDSRRG